MDRLLARMVNEGKLYEGLEPEEQYYLTQLLIDLFDEFVASEAVMKDMPHTTLPPAASTSGEDFQAGAAPVGGGVR